MTDQRHRPGKILFISHQASRSGAPFVLLYLLQWLKKNTDIPFDVLLLETGPLQEEFEKIAGKVYLVPELAKERITLAYRIKFRMGYRPPDGIEVERVAGILPLSSYEIIYGNTIASLRWLIAFKKVSPAKLFCAIHELRYVLEMIYPREFLQQHLPLLDLVVPGSEAVASNLMARYQVPREKIRVVPSFIHTHIKPTLNPALLTAHGVPANRFIIGGAGTAEWRKGTDLLVPLAISLRKNHPEFDFHLVWLGSSLDADFHRRLGFDIENSGMGDRITLLSTSPDYLDYVNTFDVFAMLSREDPFPLIGLDAGYLEKPVVMFRGTGGTAELLQNGGGVQVDYLDIAGVGEACWNLFRNEAERKEMGSLLKKQVEQHYNSDVACRTVLQILEQAKSSAT